MAPQKSLEPVNITYRKRVFAVFKDREMGTLSWAIWEGFKWNHGVHMRGRGRFGIHKRREGNVTTGAVIVVM